MALWIQNLTPERPFGQDHEYKVQINDQKPLAFFKHCRQDGPAACLRAAADAVEAALKSTAAKEEGAK